MSTHEEEDITLELKELRAALLLEEEEVENGPSWNNNSIGDDSFLRMASSIDTEAILESITNRMNRLKNELTATSLALVPSIEGETPYSFSPSPVDALETIAKLKADLLKCSEDLVSHSSLAKFEAEEVQARENRKNRISRLEKLVSALSSLASHQRYCDDFDQQLELGNIEEATELLNKMEECTVIMSKISSSTNTNSSTTVSASRVAKAARVQTRSRRATLQARLDEAFVSAIQFQTSCNEKGREIRQVIVHKEIRTERLNHRIIRLEKVVEAMHSLKVLSPRLMEHVAQPLLNTILIPFITSQKYKLVSQEQQEALMIQIETTTTPTQTCQVIFEETQFILRFIWSEILNRDTNLMLQLNLYAVIEPILKELLRNSVPESFDELSNFRMEIGQKVRNFDKEMEIIGVCRSQQQEERLVEFVSNVDTNFSKRLRERSAERVRETIRNGDLQLIERVDNEDDGKEPDYFIGNSDFCCSGEMKISKCARKIARIAEENLIQAEKAPENCVEYLLKASRDCFHLFRVLVPYLRRNEVNPRDAMIHRNDCDYLAHHLTLLSHRHPNLKNFISVDLAPYFFDEADKTFSKEVENRSKEIESIFQLQDFSYVLQKSDSIYQSWKEVLPKKLAEQTKLSLGEALSNGAFQAVCSHEANVSGERERRALLKKLTQFGEQVKSRGATSLKKIEQLCITLQPHMSLPLFEDLVETELSDWPPQNLVNLAKALFANSASQAELKAFEEKIFYY